MRARADRSRVRGAVIAAFFVLLVQVASKAIRDAIFLRAFPATELPKAILFAAAASVLLAVWMTRAFARYSPARVVPVGFLVSAALFVAETMLASELPRAGAAAIYVHVSALNLALMSGFWSVISEAFDPHRAKLMMSKLGAGATLGGAAGGLLTRFLTEPFGSRGMVLSITLACALCALLVDRVAGGRASKHSPVPEEPARLERAFAQVPHLKRLALLALCAAAWSTLLDFAMKAAAQREFNTEAELAAFFGYFYAATSATSFVLQTLLSKRILERYGLTAAALSLPAVVLIGGALASQWVRLASISLLRAAEAALANSLYRAGYELFYTPLSARRKRTIKPWIDLAASRLGDGVGALLLWVLLSFPSLHHPSLPIYTALGFAALALSLGPALHRGYTASLKQALVEGIVLDPIGDAERTTHRTLNDTMLAVRAGRDAMIPEAKAPQFIQRAKRLLGQDHPTTPPDETALALLSDDEEAIDGALSGPLLPMHTRLIVKHLCYRRRRGAAKRALTRLAGESLGALHDVACDPNEPDAARGAVVAILAEQEHPRAQQALLAAAQAQSPAVRKTALLGLCRQKSRQPLTPAQGADLCLAALAAVPTKHAQGRAPRSLRPYLLPLGQGSEDKLGQARLMGLLALQTFLEADTMARVAEALISDDARIRGTAVELLEVLVPLEQRAAVIRGLAGRRPVTRGIARRSLMELSLALETKPAGSTPTDVEPR